MFVYSSTSMHCEYIDSLVFYILNTTSMLLYIIYTVYYTILYYTPLPATGSGAGAFDALSGGPAGGGVSVR